MLDACTSAARPPGRFDVLDPGAFDSSEHVALRPYDSPDVGLANRRTRTSWSAVEIGMRRGRLVFVFVPGRNSSFCSQWIWDHWRVNNSCFRHPVSKAATTTSWR